MMIHRERTRAHRHPVLVHRSKDGRLATLLGWAESGDEAERESTGFEARPPVPLECLFLAKAARS